MGTALAPALAVELVPPPAALRTCRRYLLVEVGETRAVTLRDPDVRSSRIIRAALVQALVAVRLATLAMMVTSPVMGWCTKRKASAVP